MNAKPETDVDTDATVSAARPIPWPATKKSLAVRVRRVAQMLMSTMTAKYASATATIVGLVTRVIGPAGRAALLQERERAQHRRGHAGTSTTCAAADPSGVRGAAARSVASSAALRARPSATTSARSSGRSVCASNVSA